MSVKRPRGINGDPNSRFMKAIRFALVTLLLGLQPDEPVMDAEPAQEENYDDGLYYKGIEKKPDKKLKEKIIETDFTEDPACTSDTCKYT